MVELAQQIERVRVDRAFGMAAGAERLNRPRPSRLRIASAMIERAELPVQRNSTLYCSFITRSPRLSEIQTTGNG
jgi:hypothetical protein